VAGIQEEGSMIYLAENASRTVMKVGMSIDPLTRHASIRASAKRPKAAA